MAKKTEPKRTKVKRVCEDRSHNIGMSITRKMHPCANLDYCVPFGWRKSEAREKKEKIK